MDPLNPIESTYRRLKAEGKNPVKLFLGNPNDCGFHFPKEILTDIYQKYFTDPFYRPHPKGLPEARRSIAEYYSRQDLSVDSENILITSGTSESFLYLFCSLAEPGDNILVPHPAYPLFEEIARMARVQLRHYPLREENAWEPDLEVIQSLSDHNTRAILIISPNNPTGAVFPLPSLRGIAAFSNLRGIPLICDEVFSEFYFSEGKFPRTAELVAPELCFTLGGISKMFALPALKLSWIAITGDPPRVNRAVDRLETMADTFLTCHTPIQWALPRIFAEGGEFQERYRREVRKLRDFAVGCLGDIPGLSFVEPRGGFYLTVKVEKELKISEEEFVIRLMEEKGLFVHPGYFFDYESGIHFVMSFLNFPEVLRKSLSALEDFIHRIT